MSGKSSYFFSDCKIVFQHAGNFVREIEDNLSAAFARYQKAVHFEVDVIDVDADALADADSGAEKERQHGEITSLGMFVPFKLSFGKRVASVFGDVKHAGDFIDFEAKYWLIVELGKVDQLGNIAVNTIILK